MTAIFRDTAIFTFYFLPEHSAPRSRGRPSEIGAISKRRAATHITNY